MSISSLGSYNLYSTQSSELQALLKQIQARTATQAQASSTGATDFQLSVSPMAQYLSKAPKEIADSLKDLVTTRKDVTADLQALRNYYTAHPEERTKLDAAIQLQSAFPVQTAAMTPAMQAGVVDLYALSSELGGGSDPKVSDEELGKAILAALKERNGNQGSLLDALSSTDLTASSDSGIKSLFSYLT